MNKIQELREKRAKAWEDAKKLLDSSRDENGMLTPETAEAYDRMEADIVNLGKEIDRLERAEAMERELSRPLSMPITEKPGTKKPDSKTGRASEEYRQAFWNAIRSKSPRYEIINALQESQDTEGGYLVPETFEGTLIQSLTKVTFSVHSAMLLRPATATERYR